MATREQPADRGRRSAREALAAAVRELRDARIAKGLSQGELAAAVGTSRQRVGRLERGEVGTPDLALLGAVAAVLGLATRLSLYPEGEPVRDRVPLRLLPAVQVRVHPSLVWRFEVGLPIAGDRRAWDAVAIAEDGGWTGIEGISRIGAVDATLRGVNQKQRDDPRITRVVLVVADTLRNRDALRLAIATVRADYPLDTRSVLRALGEGRTPPLNGVVIQRIPRDDPQPVHTGGKVVDGGGARDPKIVDNPVGATRRPG